MSQYTPGSDNQVPERFATFYAGDQLFGVDVLCVQEVIRYQEMTPVPLSNAIVRGLINLRGQIITAVDLRRRLQLEPLPADRQPMNVVVKTGGEVLSLLVDRIGDVVELSADSYEETPRTLDSATRDLVSGVYKLEESLMLVLDVEQVVELSDDSRIGDTRALHSS